MKIFFIALVAIMVVWTLWGYFSSRVEQARYTVVKKANGYEVRDYPAHIVAQTTVMGPYQDALNQGFRIIAGYIFGGNKQKQSIAMTAPVTEQKGVPQKIAMTAPVTATVAGDSHVISFVMPAQYSLETLPVPDDSRVSLVMVTDKKMAVLRFSWWRSDARIKQKEVELLAALAHDDVETAGDPSYAGYNAPWTPPWMTRNEVMIEIK